MSEKSEAGIPSGFAVFTCLLDTAEAVDEAYVDAKVVLDGASRTGSLVVGREAEEGADVGRCDSEGEVGVEVVVEVGAQAEGGSGI